MLASRRTKKKLSAEDRQLIDRTIWWLKEYDLIITRKDKTKKMVLMYTAQYDSFLQDYISKTNPRLLTTDLTIKIAKVERIVKNKMFPEIWRMEKITAPVCPRLFGYMKTHKFPLAMRPIVEKRTAPTYHLLVREDYSKMVHQLVRRD